jgi:uncharacterized protein YndB with AHSA1/START domain
MNTDRIEKNVLLRVPLKRVWRALSDSAEFGSWFGMRVDGPFEPGRRLRAVVVPTTADPEVAEAQKPYEGMPFEITIERMETERLFSFRWTHAAEPAEDSSTQPAAEAYSKQPTTLVVFTLEEQEGGVLLTVTESEFEQIPLAGRAKLIADNEQGWTIQMRLIEAHLVRHP